MSVRDRGTRISQKKDKPALDKAEAIKDWGCPETKEAVKSFLGMAGYLSKFIPRYPSMTAPLRRLTQGKVRFQWGNEEQLAFEKLKESISSDKTMIYFKPIVVKAEASYHDGLSAVQRHWEGIAACTFYKSHHEKYREKI